MKRSGESAAVSKEQTSAYLETILPNLLERYSPDDIYNVDETGLFYRLLPDRTYALKGETCHGGKNSKERISLLLGSNMTGTDKLKPLVIGRAAKPRCFKGVQVESLPVYYKANAKAWMTSEIFNQWLSSWNRKLQNHKVLLFIDNCPAHNLVGQYSNIEVHFLPPNTTSVIQPMDQGIIKSFKAQYRRRLVHKYLAAVEKNTQIKDITINVKEAIDMAFQAWQKVTSTTIANCFKKAGFIKPQQAEENAELDEEPLIDNDLWQTFQNDFQFNVDFQDYVSCDSSVVSTEQLDEESIVQNVLASTSKDCPGIKNDIDKADEDDDPPNPFVPQNTAQCLQYISGIRQFFQASHLPEAVFDILTTLEEYTVKNQIVRKKKQSKITDIFVKSME